MTVTEELPHTDDELRAAALQRLKKRQDLRAHLLVYALVNAVLWAIWALTGTGFVWPAIVSAAWGVGLVMNVWEVYGRRPIGEADVQREVERLRGSR
jgi:hypothetical protein